MVITSSRRHKEGAISIARNRPYIYAGICFLPPFSEGGNSLHDDKSHYGLKDSLNGIAEENRQKRDYRQKDDLHHCIHFNHLLSIIDLFTRRA